MTFAQVLKSKTMWAGVFAAASVLLPTYLPAHGPAILQALAALLGAFGLRDAIAKNGTGQ